MENTVNIDLLNYLHRKNKWITIQFLTYVFNCHEKTIIRQLKKIEKIECLKLLRKDDMCMLDKN